jgi:Transposase IS66 family
MASGVRDRRGSPGVGGAGRQDQRRGRLEREKAALREQVDRLRQVNQQLQTRVRKLTGQVEELRRAAKRQAAPFSKESPSSPRVGWSRRCIGRAGRRYPHGTRWLAGIRASPVVAPDETGWRVAGHRAWLWAFAGQGVVVYRIARGRGFDDAKAVLGADYAGVLERDGWAPYRRFATAAHQTCLAHLLRRCRELLG